MTTADILSKAADDILAALGKDVQFSPSVDGEPETVRILLEQDKESESDVSGGPRYASHSINERALFISVRTDRFEDDFVRGQEVLLDGKIYSVGQVETDGPLVELELLKRIS